jgi:predicted transcriptional regulator|tara:strand:+ start:2535 stop:2717 length:183 start_codon:yes stop_codon:yes gene_type:complete
MNLQLVKEQLADSNLRKVAEASGLKYNVVTRLMRGETDPKYSTVEALYNYLEARENGKNI